MTTHLPCPDCGSSDALADYNTHTHCFSCGRHRHTNKCQVRIPGYEETFSKTLGLPRPSQMPEEGLVWLRGAGINAHLQAHYDIYYSDYWDRVIIPSYCNGHLLGWQGRAVFPEQTPKYLQAKGQKPLFFLGDTTGKPNSKTIVLVEDAISAIRLGQYIKTMALLGTKLDAAGKQLQIIEDEADNVVVWLDDDEPGRTAARQIVNRLALIGTETLVLTEPEPKLKADWELANAAESIYNYFEKYGRG